MSMQSWEETIYTMLADGPTLTAAAEALLVPDVSIPAAYMYPGRILRATLFGKASNVITTPGTLTLRAPCDPYREPRGPRGPRGPAVVQRCLRRRDGRGARATPRPCG